MTYVYKEQRRAPSMPGDSGSAFLGARCVRHQVGVLGVCQMALWILG